MSKSFEAVLGKINNFWLRELARSVVLAGDLTKEMRLNSEVKTGEGHRSIVTEADTTAETMLVKALIDVFPSAPILSEEDATNPNMLKKENPAGILDAPWAFVIDPVDGTAPRSSDLATWCVGIGALSFGDLVGSVIYAPAINSGMLVVAERGKKMSVSEWDFERTVEVDPWAENTKPKNCFVMLGVDSTLYSSMLSVLPEIASNVRCVGIANSGILALTQVACGRVQAVIQTPQKAWDWATAYRAVLESGKIFQFFRLVPDPDAKDRSDMLVPVMGYDFDAFRYLPKHHRLGFVAGEPDITKRLMNLLPRRGWIRTNPGTVSGNWK